MLVRPSKGGGGCACSVHSACACVFAEGGDWGYLHGLALAEPRARAVIAVGRVHTAWAIHLFVALHQRVSAYGVEALLPVGA